MIGEKLGKYLSTITEIQDALSHPEFGVAIFPGHKPQRVGLPAVVVSVVSGTPDYHLTGEIGDLAKIVEVDVHASTRRRANEIAELIRLAPLSGYDGGTWDDDTVIKAVLIVSDAREIDVPPSDGSDRWTYRTITDYRITYERTVT